MEHQCYNRITESVNFARIGQKIDNIKLSQIKEKYEILNAIKNNCVTCEMMISRHYEKLIGKIDECNFSMNPKTNRYETKSIIFNTNFQNHLARASNIYIYEHYTRKYSMNQYQIEQVDEMNSDSYLHKFIMNKNIIEKFFFCLNFFIILLLVFIIVGTFIFFEHIIFAMACVALFVPILLFFYGVTFAYISKYESHKYQNDIRELNLFLICFLCSSILSIFVLCGLLTIFIFTEEFVLFFSTPFLLATFSISLRIVYLYNMEVSMIKCYFNRFDKPEKYRFYSDIILSEYYKDSLN